jgi:hypothetical protein
VFPRGIEYFVESDGTRSAQGRAESLGRGITSQRHPSDTRAGGDSP